MSENKIVYIVGGAGASAGSMSMAAANGKKMEHEAIYGDLAELAKTIGVKTTYLSKTFELMKRVQTQVDNNLDGLSSLITRVKNIVEGEGAIKSEDNYLGMKVNFLKISEARGR